DGSQEDPILAGRRRWRFMPTDVSRRWLSAKKEYDGPDALFKWRGFATACLKTFYPEKTRSSAGPDLVASYLWRAYERVSRRVGHSPLDSVALFAMLEALQDGVAIEMNDFHRLMMTIKKRSALPNHAFFASGNEIDQMFIQLKQGFLDEVRRNETLVAGDLP